MSKIKYVSKKPACACAVGLDFLGDRWSLIIIRDLFKGYNTYTDFLKKSSEGIATNILNESKCKDWLPDSEIKFPAPTTLGSAQTLCPDFVVNFEQ